MYERIKGLREDKDYTQNELAHLLNCTQVCYSHYENGKRNIPTWVLELLADYYGVSVDYIMGRTNIKTPYPKK